MIRYVKPVRGREAEGLVAQVYDQIRSDFGVLGEPFAVQSPVPEVLAGAWCAIRESLIAGRVDRGAKEAVATAVSRANTCPFCVDAHAMFLTAYGEGAAAGHLARGEDEQLADPQMRALVEWAGATRSPGAAILREPPFGDDDAPELVGTALGFHYINRVVSVFLGESPFPIGAAPLRGAMVRLGGMRFRRPIQAARTAGASLELLPEVELPPDLGWAALSPAVAGAWARFAGAAESAGVGALSGEVRDRLGRLLASWSGEDPGLGSDWIEHELVGLGGMERAQARLALLTALAPHRVDATTIEPLRLAGWNDARLVAAVAWAAFTAARRVGSWLSRPAAVPAPS